MKNKIEQSLEIARSLDKWFTKNAIKKMQKDFNKDLIVVRNNQKVIGFLNYKINEKQAIILWMAVDKNYQRKGIGKKLIKKLIKILNKKVKSIIVETLSYEDNYRPYKLTRKFYLKNGFNYKFIKKASKKDHDDLVVMEKKI